MKNPPAMQEIWVHSIPGLGRFPGEGNSTPLQYSCLENSMDRGACGLQFMESQRVRLSDLHLLRMKMKEFKIYAVIILKITILNAIAC